MASIVFFAPIAIFGLWIASMVVGPVVRTVVPIVVSTVNDAINSG